LNITIFEYLKLDVVNGQVSKKLCQIIGRVHMPAESIHMAAVSIDTSKLITCIVWNENAKLSICIETTRSSATAEKPHVSCASLSRLAYWSCSVQNTAESQMYNSPIV